MAEIIPTPTTPDQAALVEKYKAQVGKTFTNPADKRPSTYKIASYCGVKVFPVVGQKHAYIIHRANPGLILCRPCSEILDNYKPVETKA